MNRSEAIAFAEKKGTSFANRKCIHFSNVSHTVKKSVWWVEMPVSKIVDAICTSINFILHNAEERKLIVLEVPTKDMKKHLSEFLIRTSKGVEYISLELTLDNFKDIRPKGSNVVFKQYIKKIYKTPE